MELAPEESGAGKKADWALGDLFRKALLSGVGALFMTEEGVRSILGDHKLPKEVVQFVVNQVSRSKEELFQIISREVRDFLESIKLADELHRVLSSMILEINTTVRFINTNDSLQPQTDTRVQIVRSRKKKRAVKKK